jgi:penicillin amidase
MHLTNLEPFSILQVPAGGNKHIVNANGPTWGTSWRQIVELGDQIRAFGIYPGGQSGNPGSPAYETFVDDWAAGRYFEINFWYDLSDIQDDVISLRLFPGGKESSDK